MSKGELFIIGMLLVHSFILGWIITSDRKQP